MNEFGKRTLEMNELPEGLEHNVGRKLVESSKEPPRKLATNVRLQSVVSMATSHSYVTREFDLCSTADV